MFGLFGGGYCGPDGEANHLSFTTKGTKEKSEARQCRKGEEEGDQEIEDGTIFGDISILPKYIIYEQEENKKAESVPAVWLVGFDGTFLKFFILCKP